MKIIFLDFDGPLIPYRAMLAPKAKQRYGGEETMFDPVAVDLVNCLLDIANAQYVISSSWTSSMDKGQITQILFRNGMPIERLHEDWVTPRKMSSNRGQEIDWWLRDHPDIIQYVAFDDDRSIAELAGAVLVRYDDGILYQHYQRALKLLDVVDKRVVYPPIKY